MVYYPKQSKNELYQVKIPSCDERAFIVLEHPWFCYSLRVILEKLTRTTSQRLCTQLKSLNVPFTDDFQAALKETDHIVDAIFGKDHGNSISFFCWDP